MSRPDDAQSLMVSQCVAPATDQSTGCHAKMAFHGGKTDGELDREKYWGSAPAALERSLKEDISLGASVSHDSPFIFYFFFPTVEVNVCHQVMAK